MGGTACYNNTQDNTMNLGKTYFIESCKIFKDFYIYLKEPKIIELNCYIIPTKYIPKFISLLKKYKVLDDLEKEIDEIKNEMFQYDIEKNIKIISDYTQCLEFMKENKEINDEFIVVDKNFLISMKYNDIDNKHVEISLDKEKNIKKIIFPDSKNINIIEKTFGFFKFEENNISSIERNPTSNHMININDNDNKLDSTFDELIKEGIITNDNKILQLINKNHNSDLSNLIKNTSESLPLF